MNLFNEIREEWLISCEDKNSSICIISPNCKNVFHKYEDILQIIVKVTIDHILQEYYKNIPQWIDIGTYLSLLNTLTSTYGKINVIYLLNNNSFNFSDSYFLTKHIMETYNKDTICKLLEEPLKYEEILGKNAEELERDVNNKFRK